MRTHCVMAALAAGLLVVGVSAEATMTAYANWNEVTDPPGSAPMADAGLDYRVTDTFLSAQVCIDLHGNSQYPEVELGAGKWGGGLVDGPDDNGVYEYMNVAPAGTWGRCLNDDEGTIEFWFNPDWDPTGPQLLDRGFVFAGSTGGNGWRGVSLYVLGTGPGQYGEGWAPETGYWTTDFYTQSDQSVGHNYSDTANLTADWNHIAFVWDATGNRTYMNGVKVGERVYAPGDPKVDWSDDHYMFLGSFQTHSHGDADGTYDALAVYNTAIYTGDTYTVPTEQPGGIPVLDGDLDGNGFVGQTDLDIVLGAWGTMPPSDPRADPSGDGFVGQTDLDTVLGDWGQGVPPSVPEPATLAMLGLGGLAAIQRRRHGR